jgi:hypothetical protein
MGETVDAANVGHGRLRRARYETSAYRGKGAGGCTAMVELQDLSLCHARYVTRAVVLGAAAVKAMKLDTVAGGWGAAPPCTGVRVKELGTSWCEIALHKDTDVIGHTCGEVQVTPGCYVGRTRQVHAVGDEGAAGIGIHGGAP